MFWGPARLQEKLSRGRVTPYSDDRVDGASYRLSIGQEVYVSPTSHTTDTKTHSITHLKPGEAFNIPPGQFAFILTQECVKIGLEEIAFISIRAKIKYLGLVNVSGFHVDPGFEGRLTFAVFNAGPVPIHLKQGNDIFLIWFSDITDPCEKRRDPGPYEISIDLANGISGELHSLESLSQRLEKIKSEMENLRSIALIGITLLGGLFLAFLSIIMKMQ